MRAAKAAISCSGEPAKTRGIWLERRACKTVKVHALYFRRPGAAVRRRRFPRHPRRATVEGEPAGLYPGRCQRRAAVECGERPCRIDADAVDRLEPCGRARSILNQISPSTAPMLRMPSWTACRCSSRLPLVMRRNRVAGSRLKRCMVATTISTAAGNSAALVGSPLPGKRDIHQLPALPALLLHEIAGTTSPSSASSSTCICPRSIGGGPPRVGSGTWR